GSNPPSKSAKANKCSRKSSARSSSPRNSSAVSSHPSDLALEWHCCHLVGRTFLSAFRRCTHRRKKSEDCAEAIPRKDRRITTPIGFLPFPTNPPQRRTCYTGIHPVSRGLSPTRDRMTQKNSIKGPGSHRRRNSLA